MNRLKLNAPPAFLLTSFFLVFSIGSVVYAQEKLPFPINTEEVEYAPSISADGKTLIFQSNRDGKFRLYISVKNTAGSWSEPKPLNKINNFGKNFDLIGGPTISYDGNTLYYFATFKGGKGNEDIYYSVREGDDFGTPVNIGNQINTKGYEGFPSISSDGRKLYFMRSMKEQKVKGNYCYSIWMSERDINGEWMKAERLPAPININCEKSPRIMSDNEMLVFASIREGSKGINKFDLYYSRLKRR